MAVKTYTKGSAEKLSENFRVREFSCKGSGCCSTTLVDDKLVDYLQQIRDHFGKPVTVTSGHRCAKHNKSVGGVTASRHMKGQAADIVVAGVKPAEVAKYAESIGVKGIGLYESAKSGYFTHIDTRTKKAFWYGSEQAYRSTFGGAPVTPAPAPGAPQKAEPAKNYDEAKAGAYKVKTKGGKLRLRAGASTSKAILDTLDNGAKVHCYGYYTGAWLYVQTADGLVGYCHSSYLAKV